MNTHTLETAKDLMAELRAHMFDCCIAGGFPRDMHYGFKPKDIDICIYNWHSLDYAENTMLSMVKSRLAGKGYIIQELLGVASDGREANFADHQVERIWKIQGHDIDVIFYEDCHPNPQGMFANFRKGKRVSSQKQLVDQFDCNLNQYIWSEQDHCSIFIGDINPRSKVYMIRGMNERANRIVKMADKADKFGLDFEYPSEPF